MRLREFAIAAALLAALPGGAARAQEDGPAAAWVQVDVIVFRQLDSTLVAGESWPESPQLAYPEPIEVLVEAGGPAHDAALARREFDAALQAEAGTAARAGAPAELPFMRLGRADSLLADRAARLAASSSWRVIEHLSWREPMPANGRPVSVLLTGGGSGGEHREIEGYLTLARSRYLHADLELWLNEFGAPGAAAPSSAPVLPGLPLPQLNNREEPADPALDPAADAGLPQAVPVLRTVVLKASRRLAPGELHYIDHPLFGVLLMARSWDPVAGAPAAEEGDAAPPAPTGAEEAPPPEGAEATPPPEDAAAPTPP